MKQQKTFSGLGQIEISCHCRCCMTGETYRGQLGQPTSTSCYQKLKLNVMSLTYPQHPSALLTLHTGSPPLTCSTSWRRSTGSRPTCRHPATKRMTTSRSNPPGELTLTVSLPLAVCFSPFHFHTGKETVKEDVQICDLMYVCISFVFNVVIRLI